MSATPHAIWIDERAKALGFDLCGVVRAAKFPELERIEKWLERGYAGEMKYLADPRRRDPESAMAGVRSVIVWWPGLAMYPYTIPRLSLSISANSAGLGAPPHIEYERRSRIKRPSSTATYPFSPTRARRCHA